MKIEDAWIDDPTLRGEYERPMLCVQVTQMPDVTIQSEPFAGGWTVGKYGPFVKYATPEFEGEHAGDFNVRFRHRFPVVVDITLFVGKEGLEGYDEFSLPLTRARQLTRKYDPNWRLLLNDKDAQAGLISWVPVESNPACRYYEGGKTCGKRPTGLIRVQEIDVPMCPEHVRQHNEKYAAKRAASSR